jgi:hypothetical protein
MKNFGDDLKLPSELGKMEIEAREEQIKWKEVPGFPGVKYMQMMESLRAGEAVRLKPGLNYDKLEKYMELKAHDEKISAEDDIYFPEVTKQAA